MKDLSILISGIEHKVVKLLDQQINIESENFKLLNKKKELLDIIEKQKINLKHLEEKSKILKIIKTFETNKETKDAKLKINELVREIDKCIAFLNI